MVRKLFLTCFMLFIDLRQGSSKLLRLAIATAVSALYLAALALARPFQHRDDLFLACLANLLLICSFVAGGILHVCNDGPAACDALVGLGLTETSVTLVFFLLTAGLLLGAILVVAAKAHSTVAAANHTLRVVATGRAPVLDLPPACHYHAFVSHLWATGQDHGRKTRMDVVFGTKRRVLFSSLGRFLVWTPACQHLASLLREGGGGGYRAGSGRVAGYGLLVVCARGAHRRGAGGGDMHFLWSPPACHTMLWSRTC